MDIWLTRDLFRHCIAAAERLGTDQELRTELTSALAMLRRPRVAADGRLQEWWEDFGEPEPGHRHLSHLFCLFPGDEVTPRSSPALATAARRSLLHRLANGAVARDGAGHGSSGCGRGFWRAIWPGRTSRRS